MKRLTKLLAALAATLAALIASNNALAVSMCLEAGGTAQCAPAVPKTDWSYSLCDDMAATMTRIRGWCEVRGGTWDGGNSKCIGDETTVSESNASGLAGAFEDWLHGPSCGSGPPPGACSNYNCNCTETTTLGLPTGQYSVMPFAGMTKDGLGQCTSSWAENVILRKDRNVGCPAGWILGSGDPDKPCYKQPFCATCVGNPIDVGNGSKMQRETDYASAAPGAVAFVRYYNSSGFFDVTSRMIANSDVWRHGYSSKVWDFTGNTYVMAMVQRADGSLIYFNASGVEMQNNDGAAHRLQKLTDGGGALTGWRLTTPASDVETYDAQGRLTSITTRAGFVTTLAYDGSGRLQTVTDAFGRSLTLGYDASGRLATLTDPASRSYTYGYDASGRLSTVTYPDTKVRTYLYEDTANPQGLTGIVDERGARFSTYAYDSSGRAISTEHAGFENKYTIAWGDNPTTLTASVTDAFATGHTYTFAKVLGALKLTSHDRAGGGTLSRTFDAYGNPTSLTDRRGYVTNYTYDSARNLETSRTEAFGQSIARTIATTWHSTYRLPATITEPSGVSGVNLVTTFTYDSAGNLTKKNLTAGSTVREWNYTVNGRGQVLTVDGPRTDATDVTTMTYYADNDACVGCRGQVLTATNAAGHVTTFNAYNLDGRPTQVTDANGAVTTLTYKPRGWLESRTVAGETTSYDYDAAGNLSMVTMPDGSWVHYLYDAANAMVSVDDSMGNVIEYELDVMGNRVEESFYDPQGALRRTSQKLYDALNRLNKDLGASAQATAYAYDSNDNVTTVTDPLFHATTNTYDALNRLTNVQDAASGNTVFTYDAKDRLLTVKDPKLSNTTSYTYDGLGNLVTQASPDTGATSFTYDNAGNVATQTDARSTVTTYSYDALNRVTAATVTDGTVGYEYDNTTTGGAYAKGRLTKVTDPSGNTAYAYDALGRVSSKTQSTSASPASKSFTVAYAYASGRQTGLTYPSGRVVTYGFNAKGQVTSITVDGSTTALSSAEYFPFGGISKWTWGNGQIYQRTFDADGRVKTLTLGPATATYADLSEAFGYDSLNRLVTANLAAGQTQSFTYDANGNRTSATINAASTTYTYPSTSHKLSGLSGAITKSFGYDSSGNTTSSGSLTLAYDGRGRMKQAATTTYLVNGLGQRVKKSAGADTFFVYDEAGHLIGEYDGTGAAIEEIVWLSDAPVAVIRPKNPSGFDLFYVWADNLGSPRMITDTSNQSRWEWAPGDPFGANAPNENPAGLGAFAFNLRFPGQYWDAEKGSAYNYFRDYDPAIGRYVESDPIGLKGGQNTFSYVGSAPVSTVDPWGLCQLTAAYWTTSPMLSGFGLQYEGVTPIHAPRLSPLLTVYMYEVAFRGSALLHARGECQWQCECSGMKLTVTSIYQPLSKQFTTPVGINILTAAFGGRGYAGVAALAAMHLAEGAVNATPFVKYAMGLMDAITKLGPAALCYVQSPPQ